MRKLFLNAVFCAVAACTATSEYDRHQMSALRAVDEGLVFETRTSTDYPADSEAAEQARYQWIQSWLDVKGYCPDGFEIVERTTISPEELNPYRYNLRYRLKCTVVE